MTVAGSVDALVEALCGDLSCIRAPRGTELLAHSWQTEGALCSVAPVMPTTWGGTYSPISWTTTSTVAGAVPVIRSRYSAMRV